MSQERLTKLQCTVCTTVTHFTKKNKRLKERLELSKFCEGCGKHTPHKETK